MCQKSHVSLRHSYYREYGAKLWTKSKNPFTSLCIKVVSVVPLSFFLEFHLIELFSVFDVQQLGYP